MKRTEYKGISTNHTIRKVYNFEKNTFELKQNRFTCGKSRCNICHPNKYTNRGKVKNKKCDMNFYLS